VGGECLLPKYYHAGERQVRSRLEKPGSARFQRANSIGDNLNGDGYHESQHDLGYVKS
jgi:hypothetical protein